MRVTGTELRSIISRAISEQISRADAKKRFGDHLFGAQRHQHGRHTVTAAGARKARMLLVLLGLGRREERRAQADALLAAVGQTVWVEDEAQADVGLRKLSTYLQDPALSLTQAVRTFQEVFLGA